MPLTLILVTLLILFGLLSYYLIFSCLNLPQNLNKQKAIVQGISLIICAKDELENLKKHLPIFLNQQGINFELILVDDQSTDGTAEFVKELAKTNAHLKLVQSKPNDAPKLKGKRRALLKGIEHASHDFLVLSDADCYPMSEYWLQEMAGAFTEGIDVVLAYSPYEKRAGLLNKLVQYETTLTAIQYLSFARIGIPYMGVGRNMAYRKDSINEHILAYSNQSTGGDDDLVVAQIATKKNTTITTKANTFVYSIPPSNMKEWLKQKTRHASTAKHYSWKNIILVGGFGVFSVLFYTNLFILLFQEVSPLIVLSIYLCKLIMFVMFNYRNFKVLKNQEILVYLPFLDVFWIIFLLYNHLKALRANNGWS